MPTRIVTRRSPIHGNGVFAVARPHHTVRVGENVVFDATQSFAQGSQIESYRWECEDDSHVDGPLAKQVYDSPGCYMATLWVTDAAGRADVDFCPVKVFSDPVTEPLPRSSQIRKRRNDEARHWAIRIVW